MTRLALPLYYARWPACRLVACEARDYADESEAALGDGAIGTTTIWVTDNRPERTRRSSTDNQGGTWTKQAETASPNNLLNPSARIAVFTRTTTGATTGLQLTATALNGLLNLYAGWDLQLTAYTNATIGSGAGSTNTGTTPLFTGGPASVATGPVPVGGRIHAGITQTQPTSPGAGGGIQPAGGEVELAETATPQPNQQIQYGPNPNSSWTLNNPGSWAAAAIVIAPAGPAVARSYTIGSAAVGVRTTSGFTITTGDHHGTGTTTITPDGTPTTRRHTPYGVERGSSTASWPNTKGYLNQPADATGLNYLTNRYYDPITSTFTSTDPLALQTRQPYAYGSSNPIAFSDPTGLYSADACERNGSCSAGNADGRNAGNLNHSSVEPVGSSLLNDAQRSAIGANPDRFDNILWDCWYLGAQHCEGMRDQMGPGAGLLDAAQLILLGLFQKGAFIDNNGTLVSPYYSSFQAVNFVTEVGPGGEIIVSLVHAPTPSFAQMVAGGLQVVGTALTVLEIGGLLACPFTGGAGCAFAGTAGVLGAAVDVGGAVASCSGGGSSLSCGWSVGVATASVVSIVGGAAGEAALRRAGVFSGGVADAYQMGNVYATLTVSMFDLASYGFIEQHDESTGVHQYSVVL